MTDIMLIIRIPCLTSQTVYRLCVLKPGCSSVHNRSGRAIKSRLKGSGVGAKDVDTGGVGTNMHATSEPALDDGSVTLAHFKFRSSHIFPLQLHYYNGGRSSFYYQ